MRLILFSFLIFISVNCTSQNIVLKNDTNSDKIITDVFHSLREQLKDSRVILIGEINHGSGSTFLLKSKLIQLLHEEMDFDVLLFESNMYECNLGWKYIQTADTLSFISDSIGVFKIWSGSREMHPLFSYLIKQAKTNNPLILSGMDVQFPSKIFAEEMLTNISLMLDTSNYDSIQKQQFLNILKDNFQTNIFQKKIIDTNEYLIALNGFHHLQSQFVKQGLNQENLLFSRVIENLTIFFEYHQYFSYKKYINNYTYESFRDVLMGLNAIWLFENYFKDKKIIIWAANYHVLRNLHNIQNSNIKNKITAGDIIFNYFKNTSYTLGITIGSGSVADWWDTETSKISIRKNSIEKTLDKKNSDVIFINYRNINFINYPNQYSNILGGVNYKGYWDKMMDGLLYISKTERANKLK